MLVKINGIENEYEFVRYLNNRRVCKLNPMFRQFFDELFGNLEEDAVIKSWKNPYKQKTDFYISINDVVKRVSLKTGVKNSVHVEGISTFIHFLIENGVNRKIIINYLLYHYADGTTNGKGSKRLSVEEYKINNQKSIDEMNEVFNEEKLLAKAIDRFVLKGRNSNYCVDAIVHGVLNDFMWMLKDDIRSAILSKKDDYSTAVHFGALTCQPLTRCLNHNPKLESKRYCIQIKWYNMVDDIIENMNNKLMNESKNTPNS